MDVDSQLRTVELPKVEIDTERALTATMRRGSARRRRRSALFGACALAAVLGGVGTAVAIARDDGRTDLATGPGDDAPSSSGAWRPLAPSPLSPRAQGIAVWTGSEVLIAGGSDTTPCPATADCLIGLEPLADAAAYDPDADTWRRVSEAPMPFVGGEAIWTGTEVLVLARQQDPNADGHLLAYDPATDRWSTLADPPVNGLQSMAWTGDSWVGITPHGTSDDTAWRYQPDTDTWEALPPDGMGQLGDRAVVWTGRDIVLVGSRYDQPGSPPNGFWAGAALGPDGTWRPLPASGIANNGGTWSAVGALVVNPGTGRDFGGIATGGVIDTATSVWSPVPETDVSGGVTGYEGVAGRWVVANDRLFDPAEAEWRAIEARPDPATPAVAAWTGSDIVSWGGTVEPDSSQPELVATGYAYALTSEPTRSEDERPGTPPLANPEPGDGAVWHTDPSRLPTPDSSTVEVLVTRLGCNGGVTGTVLEPGVRVETTRVVITFTVEADPDGGRCPSNDAMPYEVELGEPVGARSLVDGACLEGAEAATTSFCLDDVGVRWPKGTGP